MILMILKMRRGLFGWSWLKPESDSCDQRKVAVFIAVISGKIGTFPELLCPGKSGVGREFTAEIVVGRYNQDKKLEGLREVSKASRRSSLIAG